MADTQKGKKSFCLFIDQMQRVRKLSDNDRLLVYDAINDYEAARCYGTDFHSPFPDDEMTAAKYAFEEMKASLDRNAEEYAKKSKARAEAGQRGGIASGEARRAKQNEVNDFWP